MCFNFLFLLCEPVVLFYFYPHLTIKKYLIHQIVFHVKEINYVKEIKHRLGLIDMLGYKYLLVMIIINVVFWITYQNLKQKQAI